MKKIHALLLVGLSVCAGACHRPPRATPDTALRNVFTDSAYHSAMCEAPRAGESWQTSCQPKNQRLDRKFYARPPQ